MFKKIAIKNKVDITLLVFMTLTAFISITFLLIFNMFMNVENISSWLNNSWNLKDPFKWVIILSIIIITALAYLYLFYKWRKKKQKKFFKENAWVIILFTFMQLCQMFMMLTIGFFWNNVGTNIQILIAFLILGVIMSSWIGVYIKYWLRARKRTQKN